MNDDFFENFNQYNNEPKGADPAAETNTREAYRAEQEPMTQLFTAPSAPSAEPQEPKSRFYDAQTSEPQEPKSRFYDAQTSEPQEPRSQYYGAQPAAHAEPQTPAYNPYMQQPQHTAPTYTNPYANVYRPHEEVQTPTRTTSQPVYRNAGIGSNRTASDYGEDGFYHRSFTKHEEPEEKHESRSERKKEKSGIGKGAVAALLIICLLISGAAGFGGSMLASKLNGNSTTTSDGLVIHRVEASEVSAGNTMVDKTTSQITEEVANSVVEITTEVVQTSDFYGQYITQGAGSGVIISEDGTIITNNHVIEGAQDITVTLRSGESYVAQLIGADEELDIALIKIDAEDKELSVAVMGDSSALKVGDKSVIIGNPLGTLGGSVTEGIISALDRSIVVEGKTMNLMQTDAAINAGNSGGGMFNGQGELVGIVVAKNYSGEVDNIGFVIPITAALNILGDLKQYGYVRGKADTGMTFVDLSNPLYSWYYYGTTETGCYVNSVESGSNAESAGFRKGDRIISIDGTEVESSTDIKNVISGKSVGDQVEFVVERSGRTGTLSLTLEEKIPDSAR